MALTFLQTRRNLERALATGNATVAARGVLTAADAESGRIARTAADLFNDMWTTPQDYGAVADGVTDCTDALQKAIDSGRFVYLPPGEYLYSEELILARTASGGAASQLGERGFAIKGSGSGVTILKPTHTSGYGIKLQGVATNLTLDGIVIQSSLSGFTLIGPGASGNTLTAIGAVAYDHLEFDHIQIEGFGQDGIFLDRAYYGTGSPVRDDRGSMANLNTVKIRGVGRDGLRGGGAFEVDHLVTEQCEFTSCGEWGANIWAQGWVDISSLFAGVSGGIKVHSEDTNFAALGIVLQATRCEHSASVASLQIGRCTRFTAIGMNFIARNITNAVPYAVILGANSGDHVNSAMFINCFFNSDGSGGCFSIAPNGGASVNALVFGGSISASFTPAVTNPNGQIISLYSEGQWEQPTGFSGPVRVKGVTGAPMVQLFRTGDAHARVQIYGADSEIRVGSGASAALKVVGQRRPDWGNPTGTASRATFATYTAPAITNPPTQAEVQAIADALQVASRTSKALIDDLIVHGLIGA